jgi:acyl-coenzyme A synthetase/AMP-(fatty) acid ligase
MGELWVHSPCNAREYLKSPELTAQIMKDGWICTGDLFSIDDAGFFYYHGRRDQMINVGALKVAPSEVEECLMEHPWVNECCVLGTTSRDHVGTLIAFVVLSSDHQPSLALEVDLRQFLSTRLAPYKCPSKIEFVDGFPRTTTGKIDRKQLYLLVRRG